MTIKLRIFQIHAPYLFTRLGLLAKVCLCQSLSSHLNQKILQRFISSQLITWFRHDSQEKVFAPKIPRRILVELQQQ